MSMHHCRSVSRNRRGVDEDGAGSRDRLLLDGGAAAADGAAADDDDDAGDDDVSVGGSARPRFSPSLLSPSASRDCDGERLREPERRLDPDDVGVVTSTEHTDSTGKERKRGKKMRTGT